MAIAADDILIMQVFMRANQFIPDTVTGWTRMSYANSSFSGATFWRRATGSESGTINVSTYAASDVDNYAVMYRFSGCVTTGNPYEENGGSTQANSAAVAIASMTTAGTYRLCFHGMGVANDVGQDDNATYYVEQEDELMTDGSDANLCLYLYEKASAGAINDSYTQAAAAGGYKLKMALKPVASAYPVYEDNGGFVYNYGKSIDVPYPAASVGYANDVISVASGIIGKVNGVATANIAKVVV